MSVTPQLSVLADGLAKPTERRDFFEDLVHVVRTLRRTTGRRRVVASKRLSSHRECVGVLAQQVIKRLLNAEVTPRQAEALLHAVAVSFPAGDPVAIRTRSYWRRFIGVVLLCVRHLMPLISMYVRV